MNEEPVLVQADGSPSASSDEREGWTALPTAAKEAVKIDNPASTLLKSKPTPHAQPIASPFALAFLLSAVVLAMSLISLHGFLHELRAMGKTVEAMAGEIAELHEALDLSLATQVKIKAHMEEVVYKVSELELADRALLLNTHHQAQIDGQTQTDTRHQPSVFKCQLSKVRIWIDSVYDATRLHLAHQVLALVSFLASFKSSGH